MQRRSPLSFELLVSVAIAAGSLLMLTSHGLQTDARIEYRLPLLRQELVPPVDGSSDCAALTTRVVNQAATAFCTDGQSYPGIQNQSWGTARILAGDHAAPMRSSGGMFEVSPPRGKEKAALWRCYSEGGPACYTNLTSVAMISSNEGWAVGDSAIILHYVNGEWQRVSGPAKGRNLQSISMISSDDGWAVGFDFNLQRALTLHWDGTAWREVSNPSTDVLYGVSMLSHTDVWAVGGVHFDWDRKKWLATVLHYNGASWEVVHNPAEGYLFSIDMMSPADGWAVGHSGTSANYSIILRWDGSVWKSVPSPTNAQINSVSALYATEAWAVGANGTILRWNGTVWQSVNSPTTSHLTAVKMVSPTDGWAMGDWGTILHWDGSAWKPVSSPTRRAPLSISMLSRDEGWAVGIPGTVLHWEGTRWVGVSTPPLHWLHSVSMVSSTSGWAGGWDADRWRSIFLRWDGVRWQAVDSPVPSEIMFVAMKSENDGWAIGWNSATSTSDILHWNGSSWGAVANPSGTKYLSSISMVSATDGWIVGSPGAALHWNGAVWQEASASIPITYNLADIAMVSPNDGWAVGSWGDPWSGFGEALTHWNGSSWQVVALGLKSGLRAVDMASPNDGWASAGGGTGMLHWNGVAWQEVNSPAGLQDFNDIYMVSSTDGWAVSWRGTVAHWDGSSWSEVQSPTGKGLESVSMVSSDEGWAVGGGAILHFQATAVGVITPSGGALTSPSGDVTLTFPSGAFTSTVVVTYTPQYTPGYAIGRLTDIGVDFGLAGVYSGTQQGANIAPGSLYTISARYGDAQSGPAIETSLALYFWDGSQWVREPTSVVDANANAVTARPSHFSRWAVLGESWRVFLPAVVSHR